MITVMLNSIQHLTFTYVVDSEINSEWYTNIKRHFDRLSVTTQINNSLINKEVTFYQDHLKDLKHIAE